MVTFGKDAKTPVGQQVQVCMECHAKNRTELLKIKGHENAKEIEGITCSNCHTVHELPPGHEHEAAELSSALAARLSAPAEYTERGPQKCLLCHAEKRMSLMAETLHGNKGNPDTPFAQRGCESCHGKGSLHVSRSMRDKGRPPMITFGKRAKTPIKEQIQTCLRCHEKDREALMRISGHKNAKNIAGLSCSTCHTMHPYPEGAGQPPRTAKYTQLGTKKCLLCHSEERMEQVAKTRHGDVSNPHTPFAKHGCESCHGKGSLHVSQSRSGSKGRPAMIAFGDGKRTPAVQQTRVCLDCHSQQLGTFPPVTWDTTVHGTSATCVNCHSIHAEGEPALPQTQVCLDCHSQELGTLPPVVWHTTAHSTNATCINCHEVHVEGDLPAQARKQTLSCIDCHEDGAGTLAAMEWHDSVHDQQELSCSDCHTLHTEGNPLMDSQVQADTCYSCHEDRATEHPRFEDKFIDFDSLSCWTCHDVHQLIPRHDIDTGMPHQDVVTPAQVNE